jgi:hypothetical protein
MTKATNLVAIPIHRLTCHHNPLLLPLMVTGPTPSCSHHHCCWLGRFLTRALMMLPPSPWMLPAQDTVPADHPAQHSTNFLKNVCTAVAITVVIVTPVMTPHRLCLVWLLCHLPCPCHDNAISHQRIIAGGFPASTDCRLLSLCHPPILVIALHPLLLLSSPLLLLLLIPLLLLSLLYPHLNRCW